MKGPTLESWLVEEGIREEVDAITEKRLLAWQLQQAMTARHVTKTELAAAIGTSRSQLDRLLDPKNDRVQFNTIVKAAKMLGRRVRIVLEEADRGRDALGATGEAD